MRDGSHHRFWVYILTSRTGTLYVGITGYLNRRIIQHKIDTIEGFTAKYKVHRLVYYESFDHAATAISREKQLKRWRREKKIALVETTNPRWKDLAETWGREMRFRGESIGENSLKLHSRGYSLGIFRLVLSRILLPRTRSR